MVNEGDHVRCKLPAPPALKADPEDIPLEIVFEDNHLLVVNKPAHMVRGQELLHGLSVPVDFGIFYLVLEELLMPVSDFCCLRLFILHLGTLGGPWLMPSYIIAGCQPCSIGVDPRRELLASVNRMTLHRVIPVCQMTR